MNDRLSTEKSISLLRRLVIILYDSLLLFALLFFASIPLMLSFSITYDSPLYPVYLVYIYCVAFLYFGWFWTHGGQTLAMKTWNTQLVSQSSTTVSWFQALKRYLGVSIVIGIFLMLFAGFDSFIYHLLVVAGLATIYLLSLLRSDKATWYDLFSGTRLEFLESV